MGKARLEAFSDAVIAILITIMVLELRIPDGASWETLRPVVPALVTYGLSFVFLGIYWSNHHHMLQLAGRVTGRILLANLHFLFWLSLIPVGTGWVGASRFAPVPMAVYGMVLLLGGLAYQILQRSIIAAEGPGSRLGAAVGKDIKGKVSLAVYALAIPVALLQAGIAAALYVAVALMWFVPDRRIEAALER